MNSAAPRTASAAVLSETDATTEANAGSKATHWSSIWVCVKPAALATSASLCTMAASLALQKSSRRVWSIEGSVVGEAVCCAQSADASCWSAGCAEVWNDTNGLRRRTVPQDNQKTFDSVGMGGRDFLGFCAVRLRLLVGNKQELRLSLGQLTRHRVIKIGLVRLDRGPGLLPHYPVDGSRIEGEKGQCRLDLADLSDLRRRRARRYLLFDLGAGLGGLPVDFVLNPVLQTVAQKARRQTALQQAGRQKARARKVQGWREVLSVVSLIVIQRSVRDVQKKVRGIPKSKSLEERRAPGGANLSALFGETLHFLPGKKAVAVGVEAVEDHFVATRFFDPLCAAKVIGCVQIDEGFEFRTAEDAVIVAIGLGHVLDKQLPVGRGHVLCVGGRWQRNRAKDYDA